ncbi:Trk system potassium transporter TrkA [Candidatus Poribacteria bacterium]|nr:Trk system potassium transporter TrkA [Candidatus Poribacteria bacterium]
MKAIIVGAGEVGFQLSKVLLAEGYDVVAIDQSQSACDRLSETLDLMTLCGSGSAPSLLETAGISNTDLLISVTNSDETNILASLIAKRCGVKNKIARVSNSTYFDNTIITRADLGIDHTINSEMLCAAEFIRILRSAEAREVVDFADGKIQLIAFNIESDNPLIGYSIEDISSREIFSELRFVAIKTRGGQSTIMPRGSDKINVGDEVFVMGSRMAVRNIMKISGISTSHNLERLVIAGASPIGIEVAKQLESSSVKVSIIEPDIHKAEQASSILKKAIIIHGSFLERQILAEAGIREADSFISVTGDDEDDIMSCILSTAEGADRTIPLIQEPTYLPILASITEIDSAVSRHLTLVNDILRLLRTGNVLKDVLIKDIDAEVLELVVGSKSKVCNKKISDINFPRETVVGAIVRSGKVVLPEGNVIIEAGDDVVIFSQPESIPQIESLFA